MRVIMIVLPIVWGLSGTIISSPQALVAGILHRRLPDGRSGRDSLSDPRAGRYIGADAAAMQLAARGVEVGPPVTIHPATPVGEHEVPEEIADRTNLWPEVRYFKMKQPPEDEIVWLLDTLRPDVIGFGPDTGHLRWAGIEPATASTRSVARAGYRGDVEVEIFNADLWAAPPAEVVNTMADAIWN